MIEIGTDIAHGDPLPWQVIQHPIEQVIDAVRLVVGGDVHGLGSYTHFPSFGHLLDRLEWFGTVRSTVGGRGWVEGESPLEDAELLKEVWRRLKERATYLSGREQASFELALNRLRFAYGRGGDEDRLIDCWIAFEALFLHDAPAELKYRAALRIASAVGGDQAERVELYERLRKLYDARSTVAHGSRFSKNSAPVSELAAETLALLRRAIVRWLDPTYPREGREMDARLLR